MSTNHTPGPWIAEGWEGLVVNDPNGVTLSLCPAGPSGTLAETKANARLIAAAPELLELLTEALPYVEDCLTSTDFKKGVVAGFSKRIRNVIAKATKGV